MKGQELTTGLITLAVVFVGFFIITTIDDDTIDVATKNTGDFNTIAKTKLKVDAYEDRMPAELNYSGNIASLELGSSAGKDTTDSEWTSNNIPSPNHLEAFFSSKTTEILVSQNGVLECSGPNIESVDVLEYAEGLVLEADLEDPSVICTRDSAAVNISLDSETLTAENPNNRYLTLAENSSNLASGISNEFPTDWTGSGSASTSCQSSISNSQKGETRQSARENARDNAISDDDLASSLLTNYQSVSSFPNWISVDTESYFSVSYSQTNDETSECSYTHDDHSHCDEDDSDCSETHEGERYDADYSSTVTQATLEYSLTDSEREIINSEGEMETVDFKFNYTESVD